MQLTGCAVVTVPAQRRLEVQVQPVLLDEADPPVQLQALLADAQRGRAGVGLGDRSRFVTFRARQLMEFARGDVDQISQGDSVRGHVGENVPDCLEARDRMAELFPLDGVHAGHLDEGVGDSAQLGAG